MLNICIIREEDIYKYDSKEAIEDLIRKYSALTQTSHKLHLALDNRFEEYFRKFPDLYENILINAGFKGENITYFCEANDIPTADIYFYDPRIPDPEWSPNCLRIIDKLGKDKVYINSGNGAIVTPCRERGYKFLYEILGKDNVQPEDLEKLVAQ